MKLHKIILTLLLVLCPVGICAQNIDPDYDGSQYAWGENIGWINFEPLYGPGVTVSDTDLTGFAWGENIGWINLSPSYGGVFNNGCGCLSGAAWAENAGWINFAPSGGGVSIDPETGLFSGHAWGENIGWINFAPTVAGVKTSWGFEEVVGDAGLTAISETKLTADDATAGDNLGHCVAFSGDVAVAGAPLDDDKYQSSGSAYVYRYNDVSGWVQEAKLTASDGADGDNLGRSVAISGDKVVVGSILDDSGDTNAGSAYVFRYELVFGIPVWVQEAELTASDAATDDRFGSSVAISGDVAVVAAPFDDSYTGSVYVFRYNTVTGWVQEAKLVGADSVAEDRFGYSVAISGDRVVVGAVQDDDGAPNAGSTYVFRYNGSVWAQVAKLTANDAAANDNFGHSVAINGNTAAIGAPFAQGSGLVYVFRYELGFRGFEWVQKAKLTASDAAADQLFGTPIAINGETIVAGSFGDDHAGSYSGSAYVFGYSTGVWSEKAKLTAIDAAANDWFGWSVAMSGDRVVVGALYDDDAGLLSSGSLYVFDLAAETPVGNCVSTTPIEPRTGRSPVTVTFFEVLDQGTTSVTTSTSSSTPPPDGHEEVEPPFYYDVTTTAQTSSPTTVIVSYEGSTFNNESELGLFHEEDDQYVEVTTSQDTLNNTLTGLVNHLSSFAIFERTSETTANIVIDGCDTGVIDQSYDGKLISNWIDDCATGAKNHGQFVSCVAHLTYDLKKFGLITDSEKGAIQSCAAQADIP